MRASASTEPVKAILFDIDGTLVNGLSMIVAGLGDAFEKYGSHRPNDAEILALIGIPLSEQMTRFGCCPKDDDEKEEMIQFAIERYQAHIDLETEYTEAVEALKLASTSQINIALVTSRNSQELENLRDSFSAWDFVDTTVCSSDVCKPKPHPESALLALSNLNGEPKDSVFIGDSIFDLKCAKSAGIRCGAVLYGAGRKEDLLAEAPDLIFTTPLDLLEWVQNIVEQSHAKEEDLRPNSFEYRSKG
ncbi:MAG: HAD family hydrolase [Armatimonadota bacterium]